jgi:TUP1-like enhancer of split
MAMLKTKEFYPELITSEEINFPLLLASVVSCYVTENGSPAVTLSTGKVYYFCSQLDIW